jgi:hypothetical protein
VLIMELILQLAVHAGDVLGLLGAFLLLL